MARALALRWSTPDAVVEAYFAALEHSQGVRSPRISTTIEVCGRVPVRGMDPCGGARTQRKGRVHRLEDDWLGIRDVAEWVDVCVRCGEAWAPSDRELGVIRYSTVPNVIEDDVVSLVDRLLTLRALVEQRPREMLLSRWIWILGVWRVYLHPGVGTYAGAARVVLAASGDAKATTARVQSSIARGREVIQARMGRRTGRRLRVVA